MQRLEAAGTADVDELQAALYALHALIAVHFAKEEDIQMAAFDAAPAATERVLRRVAAAGGHAHAH
jgi:hemerythrin